MLKIYHIQRFFGCSKRTAYRKMQYYKDVLNTKYVTIKDFLEYENISESAWQYALKNWINEDVNKL